MAEKRKILFIGLGKSTFSEKDLLTLESGFEVSVFWFNTGKKMSPFPLLKRWLEEFFWLIREIRGADLLFGWFADHHLFLPVVCAKIFRKPVMVCLGGYDCSNMPELDHGVHTSRWRAPLARYIVQKADCLLPVTETLIHSKNSFTAWPREQEFGLKMEIPDLETPYYVLPTGYDDRRWILANSVRERRACTVGFINSVKRIKVKGIDLVIETARKAPKITFLIVGVTENMMDYIYTKYKPSSNTVLLPPMEYEQLLSLYNECRVYIQLSRAEGLPNVICEAMLCGCTPVGSNIFGIPEVINGFGYLVDSQDPGIIAATVSEAMEFTGEYPEKGREYIKTRFSQSRREKELLELVERYAR